ncbi:MAG: FAD-dependent oxidoreductase, partial [bacterium]
MTDVIVAGGGIMGLLTARELARGGRKVLLLEKGEVAGGGDARKGGPAGATWASAGIISTHGTEG